MPSYFPCPNTQCSYQFDAEILPPAAMVTCPLCRTKFPYRANRPEPAANGPPVAGQRVVNIREMPQSNVMSTVLWVGGFCVVLALLVIGLTMRGRTRVDSPSEATDAKFNIKVEPFPLPWDTDVNAQKPVNGNILGRKRTGPDAWIAVAAQDWIDRQPRSGEIDELMRGRLRGAFGTLEMESLEGESWAGQPTLAVRFTGSLDDMQIRGEAYAIAHKGIGYVFFAWAPDASWNEIRAEAAGLREKIRLANYRDKWEPKRTNLEVHTVEGASYQVEDTDGAWVRAKPAEDGKPPKKTDFIIDDVKELDRAATMAFRAHFRIKEGGDSNRQGAQALALVVELPAGGDPLEAAKAHVIERIKKDYADTVPDIKLEPMTRSPSGMALPTGGPAIGRFLFKAPGDRENKVMYVIAAISVGGKTVAVEAHTLERTASYVDEWMVHLAGSLKAK